MKFNQLYDAWINYQYWLIEVSAQNFQFEYGLTVSHGVY